jgi:DNA-binding Lrp family transcriptional regulator
MEMDLPKKLKPRLDALDARIIEALSVDARMPMSDLARVTGMSGPSITERVRKLEASGVIGRLTIELQPKMLGYTLEAMSGSSHAPVSCTKLKSLSRTSRALSLVTKLRGKIASLRDCS